MPKESKLYTILREPLLHFLLIGIGLFFIYSQLNDTTIEDNNHINITKADIQKLSDAWLKSKGRVLSEKEKEQELNNLIQEKILYREAIVRGLDKNDKTIELHLAKKMKFVFDDLSFTTEPTDAELAKFLSNNSSMFLVPASISFNQVVFTPTKDSKDINEDAKQFLQRLKNSSSPKVSTVGDEVELSEKGVTNMFGLEFASTIFSLPAKSWQGPISSKHGVHLIYIHSQTTALVPELSKIKEEVSREWRKKKQAEANEIFYKNLYKNYKITIDDGSSK